MITYVDNIFNWTSSEIFIYIKLVDVAYISVLYFILYEWIIVIFNNIFYKSTFLFMEIIDYYWV